MVDRAYFSYLGTGLGVDLPHRLGGHGGGGRCSRGEVKRGREGRKGRGRGREGPRVNKRIPCKNSTEHKDGWMLVWE